MTSRYLPSSYAELSPVEKERYNAIIKANSNRKKDLVYITKKGDKTTMTKGKFLVYFKPFEDGPQLPELFREKLGLASMVNEVPVQSTELSSKEEEEPKKTDVEILDDIMNDLSKYVIRNHSLTEKEIAELNRMEKYVLSKLNDPGVPEELKKGYNQALAAINGERSFDSEIEFLSDSLGKLSRKEMGQEEMLKIYDSAKFIIDNLELRPDLKPLAKRAWNTLMRSVKQELKDLGINPDDPQSRPNELSRIVEDYKKQEIENLQEKYKKSEEDEKKEIPTNEVTEEDVLIISSDAPLYTEPELIVKEEGLADVFLKEEPLTEVKSDDDYPDIQLQRPVSNLPLPEVSELPYAEYNPQTDIVASNITESMDSQPGSEQINETVVSESGPAVLEQPTTELGPRINVKYTFEVKYHKSQIAEYFFEWNRPAWDQQLSDSIKNSEEMYTKEYLIETMNRLIQDPRFKINKVITNTRDKMSDVLTEYHEISQIQFCIQRNMQTGKREKLIGMKLKDLVNIASLASGNPPSSQNTTQINEEVQIDDSVSQVGGNNVQMQPTPTAPNLVSTDQPDITIPRDTEITMNEIGLKYMKEIDNEGKLKNLNLKLISDMQRNSGADVIIGPFNEQKMRKSTINLEALRRIIE